MLPRKRMERGKSAWGVTRRNFLRAAGALAGLGAGRAFAQGDGRPNIVLMMADDMGYSDIGCFGGEIDTPNIDSLAAGGMRFTQFYNNAKCGPTRQSLLTGLYAQQVAKHKLTQCVTIAEALKNAGYRTLMAGKWHLESMPVHRGFDRHFGLLDGACNYWNPGHARPGEPEPARKFQYQEHRWAIEDKEYKPYTPPEKDFYTTDAFTNYAVERLEEYRGEGKPFFLYMAYNAPHYPLQAWPEDIAKYKGKYMGGWDKLRAERYARMVRMGIIEERHALTPRDPTQPAWADIEDKEAWDLKMAVYAAMVDRLDQNIAKIIAKVKEMGEWENTLFLFLSDNGGSSEYYGPTPDIPPGPMIGFRTVDAPWANASNTPFFRYKGFLHEGGISTPLVAHWPKVIQKGGLCREVGHLVDIMPTLLDVGETAFPAHFEYRDAPYPEGQSLAPFFRGEKREPHEPLFWLHMGSRAVRAGKWKLVTFREGPWELYDMEMDRTELNDLSAEQPERVAELASMWDAWAKRVGAAQKTKKQQNRK